MEKLVRRSELSFPMNSQEHNVFDAKGSQEGEEQCFDWCGSSQSNPAPLWSRLKGTVFLGDQEQEVLEILEELNIQNSVRE